MIGWSHYNPVEIHAGLDCRKEINYFLPKEEPVLIVTTKGMQDRGQLAEITNYFSLPYEVFTAQPEPDLDKLDEFYIQNKHKTFHTIIALGGGAAVMK